MAHRTASSGALALVKHDLVPAVGALPRRQLVRLDVDDVPAGALNLLLRKKARLRF